MILSKFMTAKRREAMAVAEMRERATIRSKEAVFATVDEDTLVAMGGSDQNVVRRKDGVERWDGPSTCRDSLPNRGFGYVRLSPNVQNCWELVNNDRKYYKMAFYMSSVGLLRFRIFLVISGVVIPRLSSNSPDIDWNSEPSFVKYSLK